MQNTLAPCPPIPPSTIDVPIRPRPKRFQNYQNHPTSRPIYWVPDSEGLPMWQPESTRSSRRSLKSSSSEWQGNKRQFNSRTGRIQITNFWRTWLLKGSIRLLLFLPFVFFWRLLAVLIICCSVSFDLRARFQAKVYKPGQLDVCQDFCVCTLYWKLILFLSISWK
jgi:hypothetical protein